MSKTTMKVEYSGESRERKRASLFARLTNKQQISVQMTSKLFIRDAALCENRVKGSQVHEETDR